MSTTGTTYHVVWYPKYRRKVLTEEIAQRLQTILKEACQEHQAEVVSLEVMPDHVHLLVECDPQFGIHREVAFAQGAIITVLAPRVSRSETEIANFVDE